jgi:hypothetical protein
MSAGPPGVMGLSSALLFVTSVLKSLQKDNEHRSEGGDTASVLTSNGSKKVVAKVSDLLEDCADLCNRFTMATNDPNRLYETLLQVCV